MRWRAIFIGILLSSLSFLSFLSGWPVNSSWAKDSPGTAGAPFLKIPVGSKAAAMGGGFSALADGIAGSCWNPAGLVQLSRPEVCTMYNCWFKGMGHGFIGFGFPITEKSSIGMNVVHLGITGLEGYEDSDAPPKNSTGNFTASDSAFTLTYAHLLTKAIAFGLNVKGIIQKIQDDNLAGFAVDFGQMYKLPVEGLTLAVVVKNFGPKIKFIEQRDKLPLTLRFGTAYKFLHQPLTVTCDLVKPVDNDWKANMGMEVWFKEALALRAGFDTQVFEDLGQGVTCGFGFKALIYQMDYAFVPYDQLGKTHRISITFRFDAQ